jgi:hypothetical protein
VQCAVSEPRDCVIVHGARLSVQDLLPSPPRHRYAGHEELRTVIHDGRAYRILLLGTPSDAHFLADTERRASSYRASCRAAVRIPLYRRESLVADFRRGGCTNTCSVRSIARRGLCTALRRSGHSVADLRIPIHEDTGFAAPLIRARHTTMGAQTGVGPKFAGLDFSRRCKLH